MIVFSVHILCRPSPEMQRPFSFSVQQEGIIQLQPNDITEIHLYMLHSQWWLTVSGCGYRLHQSETKQGWEGAISAFTVQLRRCGRKRRGSLRWVDFPGDTNIWIIKTESDNWAERSDFCKPALSQQRRGRRYPGSTRLKLVCQRGTNERFPGGRTGRKQVLSFIWQFLVGGRNSSYLQTFFY